jgi:hypothetical protein
MRDFKFYKGKLDEMKSNLINDIKKSIIKHNAAEIELNVGLIHKKNCDDYDNEVIKRINIITNKVEICSDTTNDYFIDFNEVSFDNLTEMLNAIESELFEIEEELNETENEL